MSKTYRLYDMQDETDSWKTSLEGAQQWLIQFWCNNRGDDMSDDELDDIIEGIEQSDVEELSDRLQGIDYGIELIEKE